MPGNGLGILRDVYVVYLLAARMVVGEAIIIIVSPPGGSDKRVLFHGLAATMG